MTNPLSGLSLHQLKLALQLKEQIDALESQMAALLGGVPPVPSISTQTTRPVGRPPGKMGMSPEGRARIAAAQKARWAIFHQDQGTVPRQKLRGKAKPPISTEGMARIIAAQKKRWARFHSQDGKDVKKPAPVKKRNVSPEARERMRMAVKARWARWRKEQKKRA